MISKGKFRKIVTPVLLIATSSAFVAWMLSTKQETPTKVPDAPVMLVDVISAKKGSVNFSVKAHGTVSPRTETILISEVSGLIKEVSPAFLVGGFFKKGDVLVRVDDRYYRSDLKRAQATVASARTRVATETGLANYAKEDWERLKQRVGYEKSASELALRKPQLAEAMANLDFAMADLDKKLEDLQRTVIRAPYDGLVREKRVDIGQYITAGAPLAVTFAIDYAEIRLPLPEHELAYLNLPDAMKGKETAYPAVTLSADIGGEKLTWQGEIVRTEGVFDPRSRVLFVVAQVADPYGQQSETWRAPLRIGTFVEASIEGKLANDIYVLPRGVLRPGGKVWVVDDKNTIQPRIVTVLRADEESIFVEAGLEDGQLICLTPLESPLPGTQVKFETELEPEQIGLSE